MRIIARIVGVALIVVAVLQWITFDYPDVNSWFSLSIFTPGMPSQILNYIIVVLIAAAGAPLLSFGRTGKDKQDDEHK